MKRWLTLLLLLTYLLPNIGLGINLHYCCGQLRTVAFAFSDTKKCCCGAMPTTKRGCCKDKQINIKSDVKHQVSVAPTLDFVKQMAVVEPFLPVFTLPTPSSVHGVYLDSFCLLRPPPLCSPSIYLRNCVFRI